jgi:hypothetical protein
MRDSDRTNEAQYVSGLQERVREDQAEKYFEGRRRRRG